MKQAMLKKTIKITAILADSGYFALAALVNSNSSSNWSNSSNRNRGGAMG